MNMTITIAPRWASHRQEGTHGTDIIAATGAACATYLPGIFDGDIQIPYNKQDHEPIHGLTNIKPVDHVKKQISVDFDLDYLYNCGAPFRRIMGAATFASPLSTFIFPVAYSATPESWSWNFRHGAKAFNARGCVTTKVGLFIEEFKPVRVKESILGINIGDGTVLTQDPVIPTGLTDSTPYYFTQISTKTMGGDAVPELKMAHFEFMRSYVAEYGSAYCYANRIVPGYNCAVLFDITAIYAGTTDNLRDKILLDANEELIVKLLRTDGEYLQVQLHSTQFTGLEMQSLKNGSTIFTVSGYAIPSGANYVTVKCNDTVDWSGTTI